MKNDDVAKVVKVTETYTTPNDGSDYRCAGCGDSIGIRTVYRCGHCNDKVKCGDKFCARCGKKLKW